MILTENLIALVLQDSTMTKANVKLVTTNVILVLEVDLKTVLIVPIQTEILIIIALVWPNSMKMV